MAATPLTTQVPRFCSSTSTLQPNLSVLKTGLHTRPKTVSSRRISLVRASSEPQRPGADAANDKSPFVSQEDLNYLVKLGAGSVAGAVAIKYGSTIFPEMTRPNLGLALLMISAPVVVAVLILIKQSRVD
ncbi:hypothetical protein PHJA_002092100 [Phtheirospermum japonicum]|uniref:Uncharacterized protein n=1 Tax=Phtheirospermum japonicum TaxID=374723 RepID=A0A830CIC0_9LAMI|nr:hypothetical protein PHJA_002092100 [Phtheirospermum japonicum]